jgi:hypothetical protein
MAFQYRLTTARGPARRNFNRVGNDFDKYAIEAVPYQAQISGAIPRGFGEIVGGNLDAIGCGRNNTAGASSLKANGRDNYIDPGSAD